MFEAGSCCVAEAGLELTVLISLPGGDLQMLITFWFCSNLPAVWQGCYPGIGMHVLTCTLLTGFLVPTFSCPQRSGAWACLFLNCRVICYSSMYECFAYMYVCVPHVCLFPVEVTRVVTRALDSLELELRMVVSQHVSTGN